MRGFASFEVIGYIGQLSKGMSLRLGVFVIACICFAVHPESFGQGEKKIQVEKQIIGRWEYDNIRKVSSSELISGGGLKSLVGENSFYELQDNNTYTCHLNNVFSRGTWKLAGSVLTLSSSSGTLRIFEVITVTKAALVLLVKAEGYHTFAKNRQILPAGNLHPEKEPTFMKPEAIMRKWILVELHDSLENKNVNDGMTSFVKGGWYDFRPNGGYIKKMVFKEKTGKWKLSDGNRTLVMVDDDGQGAIWRIGFVSATRLELHKPNSTMKHIFMAMQ
jgi:hypothetical protein